MSDVTKLTDAVSDKARLAIRQRLLNTMDLHKNVLVTQVILDIMKEELEEIRKLKVESVTSLDNPALIPDDDEEEEDDDDVWRSGSCD